MPPGLPRPACPQELNWFKIGWEFLRGRSIDDMIWARWFPPKAENYRGILHPCNRFAGLGEISDTELDRLDEEIRKEFKETRRRAADFGKGVSVGLLRNAGKLPFNIAGAILNSSEIQDIPDNVEAPGVEDKTVYQEGKITADVLTTVLGIAEVILGVGEIVTGITGDTGGGALCATGVGAPAGVAVIAGSTTLVVSGAAEVGAGITLAVSGGKSLGNDIAEFKKAQQDACEKSKLPKQAKRGQSKGGKHEPTNLNEKLAMEEAMTNPENGMRLEGRNNDSRWPKEEGWEKRTQNVNGYEIHYEYNPLSREIDDVKLK